ncbi:DUF3037 domain-containing protein [Hydrogenophaga sp. PML113]|uniref:DUF3037 domain-containing protein n=1 Tax=Hydrogenophaga sp. PML113 TaxID=1899350 RepID=UPI0009F63B22|nr:DUF3037 domain-containing protein [Hydrogenophaga sp. PML113]
MSDTPRTTYSYIVLRYIHDIGTGEFINVGVVVMGQRGSYIGAKFRTAYGRVKGAFPSIDTEVYRSRMRRLQAVFDGIAAGDISYGSDEPQTPSQIELIAHSVVRADDSSLQWSPVGSGLSRDLPATLQSLYHRFVTKHDHDGSTAIRKDDDVWRHFRTELEKRNVLPYLAPKVISAADDSIKFQHAWKNGAWHCYEPLSFDLASDATIKEKAHRWLGHVSSVQTASESFHVFFLVGKPVDLSLLDAYEKAVSILRKAPRSEVIEESRAAEFSDQVAQAISEHRLANI